MLSFLAISAIKESACNAGDPGSIPAQGRATGEGRGYPLQYSWASLVAQLVKPSPEDLPDPGSKYTYKDNLITKKLYRLTLFARDFSPVHGPHL